MSCFEYLVGRAVEVIRRVQGVPHTVDCSHKIIVKPSYARQRCTQHISKSTTPKAQAVLQLLSNVDQLASTVRYEKLAMRASDLCQQVSCHNSRSSENFKDSYIEHVLPGHVLPERHGVHNCQFLQLVMRDSCCQIH